MHTLSYRGQAEAGGVSSSLGRIYREFCAQNHLWFHMDSQSLRVRGARTCQLLADVAADLVDGHYRHANEFLWPVLHGLPEQAFFDMNNQTGYRRFNALVASKIASTLNRVDRSPVFVHDYQFARLPAMLRLRFARRSIVFWHVPFPACVPSPCLAHLSDIVQSLIHADRIGFHTQEWAQNFLNFASKHLQGASVDFRNKEITSWGRAGSRERLRTTVVVAPLAIDAGFWQASAARSGAMPAGELPDDYILSVERADYTKGVLERIEAVGLFFERNQAHLGRLTFVQVCTQTRTGLRGYDEYWLACKAAAARLNERWGRRDWQPLVWIENPLPPQDLARLYAGARALIVSPLRDGLNLTAKEFVASRQALSGVLILSRGAGAWHELSGCALPLDPGNTFAFVRTIEAALAMSAAQQAFRMQRMQAIVSSNSLERWWNAVTGLAEPVVAIA